MEASKCFIFPSCVWPLVNTAMWPEFYLLDAELADGVIHQNHHVLYGHSDVPIGPTALVRPVLGTLALKPQQLFFIQCMRRTICNG